LEHRLAHFDGLTGRAALVQKDTDNAAPAQSVSPCSEADVALPWSGTSSESVRAGAWQESSS